MSAARQYTTTGPVEGTGTTRLVPAKGVISTRPSVPVSILLLGLVAAVVAAWGAAAPFAGPDFGFVADRATAWQWSVTSACLALGPGALALIAGLIVVGAATRPSYSRRADLWLAGFLIVVGGVWFVVGQYAWPVIYGTLFIAPSNASHFMWKELAFAVGPGVILVFCGAVFMGWAVRRQLALVADGGSRAAAPGAPGVPVRTMSAVPPTVAPAPAPSPTPGSATPPAPPPPPAPASATPTATNAVPPPAPS